jgi:hypothetical protein
MKEVSWKGGGRGGWQLVRRINERKEAESERRTKYEYSLVNATLRDGVLVKLLVGVPDFFFPLIHLGKT